MEIAVVGGGCFWCIEAAYQELGGVEKVTSGYAGGHTDNPNYREVCSGETGHAEVVKIEYNESQVSYRKLLEFFFKIHNPTTENREGPDKGSQYRSIILYNSKEQREIAEDFIEEKESDHQDKIVTELKGLDKFWKAEEKHQDYFEKNPEDAYCTMHAQPKVEKANSFS
jgi:peptide-methionine (S)-S-oxide reductase